MFTKYHNLIAAAILMMPLPAVAHIQDFGTIDGLDIHLYGGAVDEDVIPAIRKLFEPPEELVCKPEPVSDSDLCIRNPLPALPELLPISGILPISAYGAFAELDDAPPLVQFDCVCNGGGAAFQGAGGFLGGFGGAAAGAPLGGAGAVVGGMFGAGMGALAGEGVHQGLHSMGEYIERGSSGGAGGHGTGSGGGKTD